MPSYSVNSDRTLLVSLSRLPGDVTRYFSSSRTPKSKSMSRLPAALAVSSSRSSRVGLIKGLFSAEVMV